MIARIAFIIAPFVLLGVLALAIIGCSGARAVLDCAAHPQTCN
jgi:hypothetical protein